jgi:two-component system CheB/CheR fusion protein
MSSENGKSLRALLEYLRIARGFDFSVYKPTTLTRRIAKRLQTVGAADYKEYVDFLEVHPEEFTELFNTILINVTSFFRDAAAWDYLHGELAPRIVAENGDEAAIRIWSAGCSSGEEAYSLATTFCDALGLEAFRRRVKIYATDIDEDALAQARQGRYSRKDIEPVPEAWREAWFEADGRDFVVKADLRRAVVFGRHDLVRDAPISRMDLLVCRNTLMYFNAEVQAQVLGRFHFALNDTGFLFLGKAEMALASARLFAPLDMRLRIFRKVPSTNPVDKPAALSQRPEPPDANRGMRQTLLAKAALNKSPCAMVVLDAEGQVAAVNDMAQTLFGLGAKDLEQPFQNLELSYRPVELRSPIQKSLTDRQPVDLKEVPYSPREGITQYLDIAVLPLFGKAGQTLGVSIAFVDESSSHQLALEVERARQEQETANEKLQSANEELQTTNEELQSTVEELQSTNEEMETMNEELRSTNEELRGANDQLRTRTDDLDRATAFTQALLGNVSVAIVAVDPDLKIVLWNKAAKNLWGLDPEEVKGKFLGDLGTGLPAEKLVGPLKAAVGGAGSRKAVVNAVDRRGRSFRCRITITPSAGAKREPLGAVLVMEEE